MDEIASRIAQRALAKRGAGYAAEVRQLLDAALEVMRKRGPTASPRVADIVAEAGLSNEAFYRHFPSKGALVAALLEDGTGRLRSYLAHRMEKEDTARGQVRSWIEGVLSQTNDEVAGTTRAVLWNAGSLSPDGTAGATSVSRTLGALLHEPLRELGSAEPEFDAALVAHAVIGALSDYLSAGARPTEAEIQRIVNFCTPKEGHP